MAELEVKPTSGMILRVAGIAVAGVMITATLVYLLVGGGGEVLAPRSTIVTYMPDATGLVSTSEVRLSGITIGAVEKVSLSNSLDPQRAVEVRLRVLTRYLKGIPVDSHTDISADTLVGSQFVDIAEGKSPIPIAPNGVLSSEPIKDAADRANLIQSVEDRLKQVDSILVDVTSGKGSLGQVVTGEALYDQFLSGITGFDRDIHAFTEPRTSFGQALYSTGLYTQMHDRLLALDRTLMNLQSNRLLASDEQYNEALASIRDLRTSLANLNAKDIVKDDAAYRKFAQLLSGAERSIASLNAGEGRAGELLTSPQLYESLNGKLHGMDVFLKDFRENPRKYLRYKVF